MNNDPILALLLKGVTDPAQREAIITAYSTLLGSGATTLPGALGILLARLVQIVAELTSKIEPAGALTTKMAELSEDFKSFREEGVPRLEKKWDEVIKASHRIRSFRLGAILAYVLMALVFGFLGGAYVTYYFVHPTPQQAAWITMGEALDAEHITLNGHVRTDGSFILSIDADRPFTAKHDDVNKQGVPLGESIIWPEPFSLQ